MTPEHTTRLFEAFPHLYRGRHLPLTQNLMSWGFRCEDGWFALLYRLSQQMTDYAACHPAVQAIIVAQVKEKFGTLRFYVDGADDHMHTLIDAAETQSAEICELDGTPGRLRARQGHYQTLCDDCARSLSYCDAPPR
jgi:hypothetical protein